MSVAASLTKEHHTHTHTHTHTTVLLLSWNMSGTTRMSRYQKGKTRKVKTNLDLLEQEIMSGSGICWAICKSAPHPRQPRQHPTTQFFTGRMPFLPPNQQRQSTEEHQNASNSQQRETDVSFVFIIFAVLLGKIKVLASNGVIHHFGFSKLEN